MKKFSEFRDKLTAKQASTYSLIFPGIFAVIMAVLIASKVWSESIFVAFIFGILGSSIFFMAFYLVFYSFIFNVEGKRLEENHKDTKEKIITQLGLTTHSRTKVKYNYEKVLERISDKEMLTELLVLPNYSFYLMLIDDEDIELTVTDKDNNIIYTTTFMNFFYLEAYFEKID